MNKFLKIILEQSKRLTTAYADTGIAGYQIEYDIRVAPNGRTFIVCETENVTQIWLDGPVMWMDTFEVLGIRLTDEQLEALI